MSGKGVQKQRNAKSKDQSKAQTSSPSSSSSSTASLSDWWLTTAPVPQCALAIVLEAPSLYDYDNDAENDAARSTLEAIERIQAIRRAHDKSYSRWPPHVNLSWPFYPLGFMDKALERLRGNDDFTRVAHSFDLIFTRIEQSSGSRFVSLLTEQSDTLTQIMECVRSLFPRCVRDGSAGVPHLSVGQLDQDDPVTLAALQAQWPVPLTYRVRALHILARSGDNDPMTVKATLTLDD